MERDFVASNLRFNIKDYDYKGKECLSTTKAPENKSGGLKRFPVPLLCN